MRQQAESATDTIMLDRGAALEIGREGHVSGPLALSDSEISRRHAVIARDGEAWTIVDQGSRNGTFVDGVRTDRAILRHGTVVRVGRTLLVHAADDNAVPVENSLMMFEALRRAGVRSELHVFDRGGHGFGMRGIAGKDAAAWPQLVQAWALADEATTR